ncbi:MAG: CD1247 N-terminal domain-containing protein [Ignavibacteriales bacterium]
MEKGLVERVAYLRGLAEGLGISKEAGEGRVLLQVIEVLQDVAREVSEMESRQTEHEERLDSIDEDLAAVEENLYEDEFDYVDIECPHCKETVCFDADLLDEESELCCPSCGGVIFSADRDEEESQGQGPEGAGGEGKGGSPASN